ncbi:hypothetical protein [Gluconobacter morbifer]|uniref:Uncharacterized protein n=1 Tax=Gluconobacter morbifer G707 TaxID=1088869 RepID=G6XG62_9PROT|nr:hypothetical protein [Gluconobacter morbifer]EHH69170.1 hypothetical protein GMO_04770 [Gluconobacter morbifer G707]
MPHKKPHRFSVSGKISIAIGKGIDQLSTSSEQFPAIRDFMQLFHPSQHTVMLMKYGLAWVLTTTYLFPLYWCMKQLAKYRPADLQRLTYVYFLSVCATLLFTLIAVHEQWISDAGYPITRQGELLLRMLRFFMPIDEEFGEILSVFILIALPFLLSYLVCGVLFGVGRLPRPIGSFTRGCIVFYAKSVLVFSAIALPLMTYSQYARWDGTSGQLLVVDVSMCTVLTLVSVGFITLVLCWMDILQGMQKENPALAAKILRGLERMSRNDPENTP